MHNKDKVIFDKILPYEYNICLYILEELCDKGVIDVFEMAEAIILLRKKFKMPVIDIYGKRSLLPCFFLRKQLFLQFLKVADKRSDEMGFVEPFLIDPSGVLANLQQLFFC